MKNRVRLPQFRHVHHKLGTLIFVLFMVLILILGLILYPLFINFYFQQVANELIHRGHGHATVLSQDFTTETLHHVAAMEQNAVTSVVVLDASGSVLALSRSLEKSQESYLQPLPPGSTNNYYLVERDWQNKPYLVAKSPVIQQGKTLGTVIMFTPTEPVRSAIQSLQKILVGITFTALFASAVLIFLVSKWITRPLVGMKDAVQQLTRNNYQVSLPTGGNDEVAELNRSLMELSQELKHYRAERQEFLAEVSHELRTPITYIRGYADILRKEMIQGPQERQKYLQFIFDATNRLFHLINDLFELVQLDQVDYRIHKIHTNLPELIEQVVNEMRDSYTKSNLSLKWIRPERQIAVGVDTERIRQILINLLENARKYTPKGGKVEIGLRELSHTIEIQIQDTGIGIPKENLHQIWQRFYRVEKSRSREYGGAGLGLAICRRIVELHGGSIQVESTVGEGSTFTISLPK